MAVYMVKKLSLGDGKSLSMLEKIGKVQSDCKWSNVTVVEIGAL